MDHSHKWPRGYAYWVFLPTAAMFPIPIYGGTTMKMTLSVAIVSAVLTSGAAYANCIGSPGFQTCTDQSGNTYSVNRLGNMTTVNGYNAQTGSSWRETANKLGNTTMINGTAANGQNWNETIQNFGNGNRAISGVDSNGNSFNHYCTAYGCN